MHDVTTTAHPSVETPVSADAAAAAPPRRHRGASLLAGSVVLTVAFLGGVILGLEPGQNAVDSWGFSTFSIELHSAWLRAVSDLGLAPVTFGVALAAAASVWRRDRRRAIACLCGPGLAVGLAELLKILVGRTFQGALCWPSGTEAAVAAVVTVVVLVTRGWGRWVSVVVGSAVVIAEAIALVAFRWHYPSDALGGIVVGVGSTLMVDALFHRLRRLNLRRRPVRSDRPDLTGLI